MYNPVSFWISFSPFFSQSVDVEWPPFIDPIDTTNGKIEKCSDDSDDKDNSSKQKVLIQQDSTSSMNQQENGSSDIPRWMNTLFIF